MTNREFLTAIIEANLSDEMTEKAQAMLAKIDERNEKRASTPSKTALANAPIKDGIVALLQNGAKTAAEVGGEMSITTQKASALLRQLCEDGVLKSDEVKVKGKGKVKSYAVVTE